VAGFVGNGQSGTEPQGGAEIESSGAAAELLALKVARIIPRRSQAVRTMAAHPRRSNVDK
jgi:hypothetical protein